jgi:hypothetical protein
MTICLLYKALQLHCIAVQISLPSRPIWGALLGRNWGPSLRMTRRYLRYRAHRTYLFPCVKMNLTRYIQGRSNDLLTCRELVSYIGGNLHRFFAVV